MKPFLYFTFCYFVIFQSCTTPKKSKLYIIPSSFTITKLGDINNDYQIDTARIYIPEMYYSKKDSLFDHCKNDACFSKVFFSNKLPAITLSNSVDTRVEVLEDYNQDGIKEILIEKSWWIGSHVNVEIYSFNTQSKKWLKLTENNRFMQDKYSNFVKPLTKNTFLFEIEYFDTISGDYSTRIDTIKFKK